MPEAVQARLFNIRPINSFCLFVSILVVFKSVWGGSSVLLNKVYLIKELVAFLGLTRR